MAVTRFASPFMEMEATIHCCHKGCEARCIVHLRLRVSGANPGEFYIKEIKEKTIDWTVRMKMVPVSLSSFGPDAEVFCPLHHKKVSDG
mgnify:FL=1